MARTRSEPALERAVAADAASLASLRRSAGIELPDRMIAAAIKRGDVHVVRDDEGLLATLTLSGKKPWSIDAARFAPASKPLYLTGMAVRPAAQRCGVGRRCLDAAIRLARSLGGDAVRLDAYDRDDGAGGFYRRCGFVEVGRAGYRGSPLIYFELRLGNRA